MRTNSQKVANLVHTDSPLIETCIRSANLLINEKLSDFDVSENLLTEIETFLAAHFLVQNADIRKKTGIELLQYKEGLKNSNFGQQAIMLDPTNVLRSLNRNGSLEFKVI